MTAFLKNNIINYSYLAVLNLSAECLSVVKIGEIGFRK